MWHNVLYDGLPGYIQCGHACFILWNKSDITRIRCIGHVQRVFSACLLYLVNFMQKKKQEITIYQSHLLTHVIHIDNILRQSQFIGIETLFININYNIQRFSLNLIRWFTVIVDQWYIQLLCMKNQEWAEQIKGLLKYRDFISPVYFFFFFLRHYESQSSSMHLQLITGLPHECFLSRDWHSAILIARNSLWLTAYYTWM